MFYFLCVQTSPLQQEGCILLFSLSKFFAIRLGFFGAVSCLFLCIS
jgi:hypothetical protein